jgi:hypothetical protein
MEMLDGKHGRSYLAPGIFRQQRCNWTRCPILGIGVNRAAGRNGRSSSAAASDHSLCDPTPEIPSRPMYSSGTLAPGVCGCGRWMAKGRPRGALHSETVDALTAAVAAAGSGRQRRGAADWRGADRGDTRPSSDYRWPDLLVDTRWSRALLARGHLSGFFSAENAGIGCTAHN